MGITARFGLRYPERTDDPNVPVDIAELAADSDGWLSRAFRCTSTTRPASPPDDFLIRETDTGDVLIWTGAAWETFGGSGGGGLITAAECATYSAATAQSIPSGGSPLPLAFGTAVSVSTLVTRSVSGAGHKFVLGRSAPWLVAATARFATTASAAERTFELLAGAATLAKAGGPAANLPFTASLSCPRFLASGTEVTVAAFQATGAGLNTEPNAGAWVHIDLVCLG